ncbi:MAG TPA: UGSC family (seleno)protein [Solirubrobacteraceae bacterium]
MAVHTKPFARLARSVARVDGRPALRQTFVPQPVVGVSTDTLRSYIEGADAVQERPFMQGLIEGLTAPLSADDTKGLSFDRSIPRLLDPDSEDSLRQRFEDNAWTDHLPIVLPTEERVEAMLAGTSHAPDEVVGRLRPTAFREFCEFTVEKVAVNAVMAGAKPEYLPVILAIAASEVSSRSSSTTSFAGGAIINGPIRSELGMNAGIGAMGPYNHANTTIGRAQNLLSQNLQGGSLPGETYMGSQGNPLNLAFAFPENEERSPWEPFHVSRGFDADASTVSVFMGGWYTIFGAGPRELWENQFARSLLACEPLLTPILALDPLVAKAFVERGFDTKRKLVERLAELTMIPARDYWDNMWSQTLVRPLAVSGIEPYASRLAAGPDELIQMFGPDNIEVVVVGGETQPTWRILAGEPNRRKLTTVSIDDWR